MTPPRSFERNTTRKQTKPGIFSCFRSCVQTGHSDHQYTTSAKPSTMTYYPQSSHSNQRVLPNPSPSSPHPNDRNRPVNLLPNPTQYLKIHLPETSQQASRVMSPPSFMPAQSAVPDLHQFHPETTSEYKATNQESHGDTRIAPEHGMSLASSSTTHTLEPVPALNNERPGSALQISPTQPTTGKPRLQKRDEQRVIFKKRSPTVLHKPVKNDYCPQQ